MSTARKTLPMPSAPRTSLISPRAAATRPAVFSASGSASCSLLGRCSSVSRQAESSRAPSTVSISQAAAHASSPRARNAAYDLRAEWRVAARPAARFLGL